MATIRFNVKLSDFDREAFDKIRALDAQRSKIVEDVTRKFKESGRYRAAVDLADRDIYGEKMQPLVAFDRTEFSVSLVVDEINPSPQPTQYLTIGEKTLNALLNGKLLSDAEKRKLINVATKGIIEAEAPKEEAEK